MSNAGVEFSGVSGAASRTLDALFKVAAPALALNIASLLWVPSSALTWGVNLVFATILVGAYLVHRLGRTRGSAALLSTGFWLAATVSVYALGGMRSPGLFVYVPVVATASLCWSLRAGAVLTVASAVVVLTAAQLDALGLLPEHAPVSVQRLWIVFTGCLLVTAVVATLSWKNIDRSRQQLEKTEHQLARLVRETRAEIEQEEQRRLEEREHYEKRLETAERLDAIGRLTGSVAHDFNNLLTVILNATAMLKLTLADDARAEPLIAEIDDAAGRSAEMVKKLLTIRREQPTHKSHFDVGDAVLGMRRLLESLCGRKVQLTIENLSNDAMVWADRVQLEQIVLNLVVNARDAMPNGGKLRVTLESSSPHALSPHQHVPWLSLKVEDEGMGMDEGTLERIFEPFFTTKDSGAGTGLGLATVHSLVRECEGIVSVTSKPGSGSSFEVKVPCLDGNDTERTSGSVEVRKGQDAVVVLHDGARRASAR